MDQMDLVDIRVWDFYCVAKWSSWEKITVEEE
jgi:hypothetical protein